MAFGLNFRKKFKLHNLIGDVYKELDPETKLMIHEALKNKSKSNGPLLEGINAQVSPKLQKRLDNLGVEGGFVEKDMKSFKSYCMFYSFQSPGMKKKLEQDIEARKVREGRSHSNRDFKGPSL